ncbi:MAG: Zn-dependent hydrolase [Betaproteobacteria bacterium]|nr:Zn-dependent hydrolase [Betaproteobacteria bacterium]
MLRINGERLIADLRTLSGFGKYQTGVDRVALSAEDIEARRWLYGKLKEIELDARMDRYGTVVGFNPKVQKSILIGSHSDTVPRGGWLDGALGVIYGLEIARARRESGNTAPVGIDVVSFSDEEGTYLPCFGARSFCGVLNETDVAAAKSKTGALLTDALAAIANEGPLLRLDRKRHIAYLEAHIEQGPRLESSGAKVGVVTGIVGIRRFRVTAFGQADHAGTTPIGMRKDAAAALFNLAVMVEKEFPRLGGPDTVWNIGTFSLHPGAANVVPSQAEMTLEFRDTEITTLDRLEVTFISWVADISKGMVKVDAVPTARIIPAAMSPQLGAALTEAAIENGDKPLSMPSGAGHDAMFLTAQIPSAMMFIPSIGGRSHDITENTADSDIIFGCQVMADATEKLIRSLA